MIKQHETIDMLYQLRNDLITYLNQGAGAVGSLDAGWAYRNARSKFNERIDDYLHSVRSHVQLSLREIKTYFGYTVFEDMPGVLRLCNKIDEMLVEGRKIMENMMNEEFEVDIHRLVDAVFEQTDLIRQCECVDDAWFHFDMIGSVLEDHIRFFKQNRWTEILERALYLVCGKDVRGIEECVNEYAHLRYEDLVDEAKIRKDIKMKKELAALNELYKDMIKCLEEKERGGFPDVAIDAIIERYKLNSECGEKYYFYLNAIHEMTWTKSEYSIECIKSDNIHFREAVLTEIAQDNNKEVKRCEYCGELHLEEDLYDGVDDIKCCQKCFEERFYVCDECGETFWLNDGFRVRVDDCKICEDCYEEHYFTCEDCGYVHHNDHRHWIDGYDVEVCDSCYDDDYTTCDACGCVVHRDDAQYPDCESGAYCEDCYNDNFTVCDDCGCDVNREDAIYLDELCGYVCQRCYEERHQVIHSYHDDCVEFDTLMMPDESWEDNPLTIGIEHEVGGSQSHAEGLVRIVNKDCENVALFRDGSVRGFEIVTMPMTIRYFYERFLPDYKKGLKFLRENDFKGEGAGGIHIHFSKLNDKMHVARMCNVLYGDKDAISAWLKITDRDESLLDRWASMKNRTYTTLDILRDDLRLATHDRYTALNYDDDRTDTHEFRMYNSTLNDDKYVSYVESALALIEFVKVYEDKGAYVTTRDYLEWLYDHKDRYPTAYKVLEEKEVFEFYGIGQMQLELNLSVGDVELTQEDHEEIEGIVNNLFGIPPITAEDLQEEAVG